MISLTDLKKGDKVVIVLISLFGESRRLTTIKKCNESYIHLEDYKTKFSPKTGLPWHNKINEYVRILKIEVPTEQDYLNAEFYSLQAEIFRLLRKNGIDSARGRMENNPYALEENLTRLRNVVKVLND